MLATEKIQRTEPSSSTVDETASTAQTIGISGKSDIFETYAVDESKFKEALCAVRPEFNYLSEEEVKQLFVESDLENDEILVKK